MLAWASGAPRLAVAIAAVIFLNAGFSFAQELQAERAVEVLAAFLPERPFPPCKPEGYAVGAVALD